MSRDPLQVVEGHARVREPRETGVAEVVAAQVLVAEEVDDVVPVGGVAQNSRADSPAAWSNKQPGVSGSVARGDPAFDQLANLLDDWHCARGGPWFPCRRGRPARLWFAGEPSRSSPPC